MKNRMDGCDYATSKVVLVLAGTSRRARECASCGRRNRRSRADKGQDVLQAFVLLAIGTPHAFAEGSLQLCTDALSSFRQA